MPLPGGTGCGGVLLFLWRCALASGREPMRAGDVAHMPVAEGRVFCHVGWPDTGLESRYDGCDRGVPLLVVSLLGTSETACLEVELGEGFFGVHGARIEEPTSAKKVNRPESARVLVIGTRFRKKQAAPNAVRTHRPGPRDQPSERPTP